jgi:hypothetical protein
MIGGLNNILKPFLNKVLIEDGIQAGVNNKSQIDLYYKQPGEIGALGKSKDEEYKIQVTMDFCIKSVVDYSSDYSTIKNLNNALNISSLNVIAIGSKSSFLSFLSYSEEGKIGYLNNFKDMGLGFPGGQKLFSQKFNIENYFSIIGSVAQNETQQKMLNVPVQMQNKYGHNLSKSKKNPGFLAYIFFITVGQSSIVPGTINAEVIFNDSMLYNKSGYFTIGKTFGFGGKEYGLSQTPKPQNLSLFDPLTGKPVNINTPQSPNEQANILFGAPGEVWVGPTHLHPMTNSSGPTNKARVMAGANHDSAIPHPFLDYVVKGNSKLIDFRAIAPIEDLFSWKSSKYEAILAAASDVSWTGQNKNKSIEKLIANKSIVSESKFSIRPIKRGATAKGPSSTKDNIILFFAIDKRKLLKQTTSIPLLLESLTRINPDFNNILTSRIEIFHFEIIRFNRRTKESKTLLVGNNDKNFNDFSAPHGKGFSLVNQTKNISHANTFIDMYEFTDAEIDAFDNKSAYSYKIKLKFRDPLISYLTKALTKLRKIIKDLDELLQKTSFMIQDPATGRFVSVYDRYQKQLNPTFVAQTLNPSPDAVLPLSFAFEKTKEIPMSVQTALTTNIDLQNLTTYFSAINFFNVGENWEEELAAGGENKDFINYVRSSLRLSTTNPTLIEKVRSLIDMIRDKTEKMLSLYSTENVVKKSGGFTTKDYLKSTGNVTNAGTHVIEFDYDFQEEIDLLKTENYFNWIEEPQHHGNTGGLKSITIEDYKDLVRHGVLSDSLSDEAKSNFAQEQHFSYSFLPYSAPSALELEKTNKINVELNYLQTIRNTLIQNITDTPRSVLVPEILATFGIKFDLLKKHGLDYLYEQGTLKNDKIPINNPFSDNFGTPYSSQNKPVSLGSVPGDMGEGLEFYLPAFGSVEDPKYAWQGGKFKDYPYTVSLSLINLINTDINQRKNIKFLNETYTNLINEGAWMAGIPANMANDQVVDNFIINNKNVPYGINLFSLSHMTNSQTISSFYPPSMLLFGGSVAINAVGENLMFSSYWMYAFLLSIFARVHYLKGFTDRGPQALGDDKEKTHFDFTTRANPSFVKDMDWVPLDLSTINQLPKGKKLLCKVAFFEGTSAFDLIDQKVVDLYKNYFNYNELFFISNKMPSLRTGPVRNRAERDTRLTQEVTRKTLGKETRRLLENNNRRTMQEIEKDESITTSADVVTNPRGGPIDPSVHRDAENLNISQISLVATEIAIKSMIENIPNEGVFIKPTRK